jgi:hypothetical protein
MSTAYNIFINTERSFSEVKSSMEKILKCQMEKSPYTEDELYYTTILGLGMGLHKEHLFDDDAELKFSNYQYYINFDYIPSSYLGDYRDELPTKIAIVLADMLSLNLQCECLILRNFSTVLGKFTPYEQSIMSQYDM